jgi:hypothetical protein
MALLSKTDIKTELNIGTTETTYDTVLDLIASAVQSLFDILTRRISESQSHTEYHDSELKNSFVFLDNRPVTSISALYDDPDWEYGADSLIATADYKTDMVKGIIKYDGYFYEGFNNIKVIYTAGYTALTLPDAWKQIWIRQACLYFREAKTKEHGSLSIGQPQGGSITRAFLEDNLLRDFRMLAELEKK